MRICPDRALRFIATAVCVCGEGSAFASVRLVATSKYPYLQASRRVLDFGPVTCGVRAERDITLMNTGPVRVTCHIEADDSSSDDHYRNHGDPNDNAAILHSVCPQPLLVSYNLGFLGPGPFDKIPESLKQTNQVSSCSCHCSLSALSLLASL